MSSLSNAHLFSPAIWQSILGGPVLSSAELRALQSLGRSYRLSTGASIFSRGKSASSLVAVIDGTVGLGLARPYHPFHLRRSVQGPQWVDAGSAWTPGRGFSQDAQALSPVLLLELPLDAVKEMLVAFPAMSERLLTALAGTVQSLTGVTDDLVHKDARKRLAGWLLDHANKASDDVALQERKRELAAQLAIAPETLSRLLRQLMRAGLIEVRGYSIKLLDPVGLHTLARA